MRTGGNRGSRPKAMMPAAPGLCFPGRAACLSWRRPRSLPPPDHPAPANPMANPGEAAFHRRHWLRAGGGAAAALFVPHVLKARESAGGPAAKRPPAARSAIVIYLQGGLSHYESFDPKPEAPSAYRGEFGQIATKVPGVHFAEHLPLLAARADKFNVLRSVYVDSPSHPVAIHMTLTGWDMPGADVAGKNRNTTNPSIGSW